MTSPAAIELRDVSKSFGGLVVIRDLSFAAQRGKITALIGPNGAGKTTVFNLITNLYRVTSGLVLVDGESRPESSMDDLARRGVVRTFQTARVLPGMSVMENVLIGGHLQVRSSLLTRSLRMNVARKEEHAIRREAEDWLEIVGLAQHRDRPATELPLGSQKMLEVVRALLARPRILMLDEPAAGLNDSETADVAALLAALCTQGITILVVEHNMSLVMNIAHQVVVMDAGAFLAAGPPATVQNDERVIASYIGRSAETARA